jgi:DUF1680 family protein
MRQATGLGSAPLATDTRSSPGARSRPLPLDRVRIDSGFWADRRAVIRDASLEHGFRMLDEWGNLDNLRIASGSETTKRYRGPVFQDSDVYKWLEAVAYHVPGGIDAEVRRMADEAISLIERAQASDGYLNSYWQIVEPTRRWADIQMGHELYCAGHLIQAAVAWQRFAGDDRLLRVVERFLDYVFSVFGPGKRAATPGHPEIEMALVELYRLTEDRRYLDLAQFFVDQRGHGILGPNPRFGGSAYYQDRVPVRDAEEVEGHAVRQLYLTTGVADLYLETGEAALFEALLRQWHDMVDRKLYLTGGAGARHQGEAFGQPYELPNDRAYCETCAAIASVMWSWRMLLATGEAKYADLIERTLFNGFLSGVSLDGLRFFYVNPLLSPGRPEVVGRGGHERREWYHVACCPPNVMRLLGSLQQYVATEDDSGVQIHQLMSCTLEASYATLAVKTDYPWDGKVELTVAETQPEPWQLRLRRPGWAAVPHVVCNGSPVERDGSIVIEQAWKAGDTVVIEFPMPPRLTSAHPRMESTRGAVAIERGPLVYCLEACDHQGVEVLDVQLDAETQLTSQWQPELLRGVVTVHATGSQQPTQEVLYRAFDTRPPTPGKTVQLQAVPYYAWANRQPGAMSVWIPTR